MIGSILQQEKDRPEDLLPLPPVVTVVGHVDHYKTSLLDALRYTNVVSGKAASQETTFVKFCAFLAKNSFLREY
jgi:hypothetical protein